MLYTSSRFIAISQNSIKSPDAEVDTYTWSKGVTAGGGQGAMAPQLFEIVGFSEILMSRRKISGLLLLEKIKVSNFIGKSLNFAPVLYYPNDCL